MESAVAPRPLERFKPTTGLFSGYAGLALAVFAFLYCALFVHTMVGLRVALAALFAGVVVWVTQLRPRVTAYPDELLLRGSVKDSRIPYLAIEEVTITQMLNVFAAGKRYVCIGIGKGIVSDVRQRAKQERAASKGNTAGRWREFSEKAERASLDERAMSYHTFVTTRIEELVDEARRNARRRGDETAPPVRTVWARPEVAALVVTALAFVVSLFV
jgi:hypothetical protein